MNKLRQRMIERMKDELPSDSPLGKYLMHLKKSGGDGPAAAEELMGILVDTFTTENGLKTLILFEKAVLLAALPNGSPDGALRENNAVRNFVLEIRRIVANG